MTADIEVCDVEYSANEQKATATTAEVVFNKDCTTDTVTVCQPENADGTQECQEVEQETCFNEPAIEEVNESFFCILMREELGSARGDIWSKEEPFFAQLPRS